ncbi:hypothetical protein Salpa_1027 [Sporomusa sp. KB1]|nr:hypothetical protein Salpa_1027 [Sporomusa sp. KB1]
MTLQIHPFSQPFKFVDGLLIRSNGVVYSTNRFSAVLKLLNPNIVQIFHYPTPFCKKRGDF